MSGIAYLGQVWEYGQDALEGSEKSGRKQDRTRQQSSSEALLDRSSCPLHRIDGERSG